MAAVHQVLRSTGRPGWSCQCQVWLRGGVDVDRIRWGMARLAQRHPVTVARLVGDGDDLFWEADSEDRLALNASGVGSVDALDERCDALLAEPFDLDTGPPIRFELLHLTDGRDVLVMQWTHPLMDRGWLLLQELDRLARDDPAPPGVPIVAAQLASRLGRAAGAARPATPTLTDLLARPDIAQHAAATTRITATRHRLLDADDVAGLQARARVACGFVNLIPAFAASILRRWRAEEPRRDLERLRVAVPLTLRPRSFHYPVTGNLTGHMQFAVPPEAITDWEGLARGLSSHMRGVVRTRSHLAFDEELELWPDRGVPAFVSLLLGGSSCPLSFHGSTDAAGLTTIAGAQVETVRMTATVLSPRFIVLSVTETAGRLAVAMPFDPESLSSGEADRRLDALLNDLLGR